MRCVALKQVFRSLPLSLFQLPFQQMHYVARKSSYKALHTTIKFSKLFFSCPSSVYFVERQCWAQQFFTPKTVGPNTFDQQKRNRTSPMTKVLRPVLVCRGSRDVSDNSPPARIIWLNNLRLAHFTRRNVTQTFNPY